MGCCPSICPVPRDGGVRSDVKARSIGYPGTMAPAPVYFGPCCAPNLPPLPHPSHPVPSTPLNTSSVQFVCLEQGVPEATVIYPEAGFALPAPIPSKDVRTPAPSPRLYPVRPPIDMPPPPLGLFGSPQQLSSPTYPMPDRAWFLSRVPDSGASAPTPQCLTMDAASSPSPAPPARMAPLAPVPGKPAQTAAPLRTGDVGVGMTGPPGILQSSSPSRLPNISVIPKADEMNSELIDVLLVGGRPATAQPCPGPSALR